MPRLAAAAAVARRAGEVLRRGSLGGLRSLSTLQPSHAASASDETLSYDGFVRVYPQVLVEGKASARAAVLNRPGHLNALTTTMGSRLNKFYESWEDNPDIGFVMMKGSGRAFCAGGDVVNLRELISEEYFAHHIREGRYQTLDECLVREYRMSINGISKQFSHEFCEGVRARLVDKDSTPKWDPPALEYVSKDMVDAYFAPLGEFDSELKLPTESREAFI
ncbi:hypothetical protein PR202_ga07775 [Eleusine coracana subsp. coracana]|uniref:3-hydroxyisobutyryl-CoA hydrolase n=1 Tax=Eleusine coracana subsp. coracana TaxID=191504 RepID=A0AAV5BYC3_ELECO|nr:hypothetical protein PR202_ga07775 [Eleusine coracana subsp. coracana]